MQKDRLQNAARFGFARRPIAFVVVLIMALGCSYPNSPQPSATVADTATTTTPSDSVPPTQTSRSVASPFFDQPDFVDPLTDPDVISSAEANLDRDSEVLGIYFNGQARAYSIRTLYKHHVINDQIGEQPLLITYCGLCSSGAVYDGRIDGERAIFGVQGAWQAVATIYDAKTHSVWMHLTGECIRGDLEGRRLKPLTVRHVLWSEWIRDHPSTSVVVGPRYAAYPSKQQVRRGSAFISPILKDTIQLRNYRRPQNELVFGVARLPAPRTGGDLARAYPFEELARAGPIVNEVIGNTSVVIVYDASTRSAIGYSRDLNGETLEFELRAPGQLVEKKTKSITN